MRPSAEATSAVRNMLSSNARTRVCVVLGLWIYYCTCCLRNTRSFHPTTPSVHLHTYTYSSSVPVLICFILEIH